jgi:hypothetical protein
MDELENKKFSPSLEIRGIADMTLDEFHYRVDTTPLIFSTGIRMYHQFRMVEHIKEGIEQMLQSDEVAKKELSENTLSIENVPVFLYNNTHRPFGELIKNNAEFSNNLERAWIKREEYAKSILGIPPSNQKEKQNNKFSIVSQTKKNSWKKPNLSKKQNSWNNMNNGVSMLSYKKQSSWKKANSWKK